MFSLFKKNKTFRSVLAAFALSTTGASVAPAATGPGDKTSPQVTQVSAQNERSKLFGWIKKFLPISEGDMPCAYSDKGFMTAGCGVRFGGFSNLDELEALRVIPKKGCTFSIKKRAYLSKMANANWDLPQTRTLFPEVERVEKIKLKNCGTQCPKSNDEAWGGNLILMPKKTLDAMNTCAVNFYIQKALEFHPNLFQLPLPDQIVVVDVIYNYGHNGYAKKGTSPKFKKAVRDGNLEEIREQCNTGSARRDCIRKTLADIPLVMRKPAMTKFLLTKTVKSNAIALYSKIIGETGFWSEIDLLSGKVCNGQTMTQTIRSGVQKPTNVQNPAKQVKPAPRVNKKKVKYLRRALSRPALPQTRKAPAGKSIN